MPAKVIDASALAALVFAEPDADSIDREIVGSSLVAPVLLYFELANVCLHKMSRYPDKRDSLLEGFELAHKMGISQLEVDMVQTIGLAEQEALTVYDAAYLWLALELNCPLVTLDRKLAKSSQRLL
jgi:predicted nucleic acid-binding protein